MQENTMNASSVAFNANESEKKTWVTPVVSDSPVNDLTALSNTPGTPSSDLNAYS